MIIVSDTSPLNYLILIGESDVLPKLFGRVLVPGAVMDELSHPRSPQAVREWLSKVPEWLEIRSPTRVIQRPGLGRGESDALSLAQELDADAILIDERRGFLAARKLGLAATGTLGVIEFAAERNLIDLAAAIAALRATSFRASSEMLDELLARDRARRE